MMKLTFRSLLAATVLIAISTSAYSDYTLSSPALLESMGAKFTPAPFLSTDPEKKSKEYREFNNAVEHFTRSYHKYRSLKHMCDGETTLESYKQTVSRFHEITFHANKWDVKYLDEFKDKTWDNAHSKPMSFSQIAEISNFKTMYPAQRTEECHKKIVAAERFWLIKIRQAKEKIARDSTKPTSKGKKEF